MPAHRWLYPLKVDGLRKDPTENEASRSLIDALPGLVWTALPDGNADFLNHRARLRALFAKQEVRAEAVDLNEATKEVITLTTGELQRNRIVVIQQYADELPRVFGDRIQLQQVILSLLLNASDALSSVNDRSRRLTNGTELDEEDRVRLSVRDIGVGIHRRLPQNIRGILQHYSTKSTKSAGMGIGLSVSLAIVESHQGRIWAYPNAGPGATFAFSLPTKPSAVPAGIRS
jgi:signal transduction histidine kinase